MALGMDFKGLVWKRVSKISFFGLKQDQDLENRAVHPIKNSQEYPPGVVCQRLFPLVHSFVLCKKYIFPTVKSALLPLFYIFTSNWLDPLLGTGPSFRKLVLASKIKFYRVASRRKKLKKVPIVNRVHFWVDPCTNTSSFSSESIHCASDCVEDPDYPTRSQSNDLCTCQFWPSEMGRIWSLHVAGDPRYKRNTFLICVGIKALFSVQASSVNRPEISFSARSCGRQDGV